MLKAEEMWGEVVEIVAAVEGADSLEILLFFFWALRPCSHDYQQFDA